MPLDLKFEKMNNGLSYKVKLIYNNCDSGNVAATKITKQIKGYKLKLMQSNI